jgi:hypothetical protein
MPNMTEKRAVKKIRIERIHPENLSSYFVSNLVVQHEKESFIMSFFEVWPPAIVGDTDEEKQAALDAIDHVDAKCVARLVVTPQRMREFVTIMSDNLSAYEAMMQILAQSESGE